jgi:flagellar biosynthesis regulator FlaF
MNRRVWTVFQSDLMDTDNQLPQSVCVNLLKLSRIIDGVTLEIIAEPVSDNVDLLIDINIGIAEGLLSSTDTYCAPRTLCA